MKNEITIPVYSEQELSPKAQDVIRGIIADGFPDHVVKFREWYPGYSVEKQVLVFGKITAQGKYPTTKFIFTYSIAQIMTKPNASTVLCAGIRQFITEPEKPPFSHPMFSASAWKVLDWFDSKLPIAVDIETSGNLGETHTPEEVGLLSVAFYQPGRPPLVIVSRTETGTEDGTLQFSYGELEELGEVLGQIEKPIWHNGKFDIRVLNRLCKINLRNWFDTMLAHHVLNHAAGDHKLKHLARQYLGAPDWEAGLSKYLLAGGHYERVPRRILVQYNGWDVYWTYKLWEFLAPQVEADEEAQKALMLEMTYAEFLLDVETYGIPFDTQYAGVLGSKLEAETVMYTDTLRKITQDAKFNPGSWQQVKKWLASRGYEVASTDETHITELMNSLGKGSMVEQFCACLLNYRKAKKMHGTYVKGWSKHERNGRVHPTFLVHGTSTGRLSSTGPNAQNVPRDKKIRRLVAINEKDESAGGSTGS